MIKLKVEIPGQQGRTCGAAFIDKKWAITAAHCFPKDANGTWNMSAVVLNYGGKSESVCTESVSINSSKIIIHENYYSATSENDIAQ